jgi:hypothetical protein
MVSGDVVQLHRRAWNSLVAAKRLEQRLVQGTATGRGMLEVRPPTPLSGLKALDFIGQHLGSAPW